LRRIRGAIGMGVTWAVAWAAAGLLIGVSSLLLPWLPWERFFDVFDAPLPALAIPGFVGGAIFSLVLGIVGRRRRFDELSLPLFALCGAAGALSLLLIPAVLLVQGPASAALWQAIAVLCVPFTLLGAGSAAGSLALARRVERRELLGAGARRDGGRLRGERREDARVSVDVGE
jgi:hypothetical protein